MSPEAWERFVEACTPESIEQFLAESCERDWLVHVNHFNLDAELEFIERNELNSMLVASDFAYPLWLIESSELFGSIHLIEAYRSLFSDFTSRYFSYEAPEKLVHVMSRQAIRKRLGLPPLSQEQIDAFYARPQHRALLQILSPFSPQKHSETEFARGELLRVRDFLNAHYPDVVAYWVTLLTKGENQGYVGMRALGGHSTPLAIVDTTIAYFLTGERNITAREAVLDLLTEGQVRKSGWVGKW